MISQFFILSSRGDTIVYLQYRSDVVRVTAEIFFRKVKVLSNNTSGYSDGSSSSCSYGGDSAHTTGLLEPVFNIDGVNFLFVKRNSLYFVCTTKFNVSSNMVLELLTRITNLLKDYCGVLSEESLRLNFALVYELLDEALDFGYPQITSTEQLKAFVYNDPIPANFDVVASDKRFMPSSATNKPISIKRSAKNEIFMDILERLTVLFAADGTVLRAEIDGCIQMKSFLAGTPLLHLGLNQNIAVGTGDKSGRHGAITLDDCNFHECVNLSEFESERALSFYPPNGEFVVMNYRINGEFVVPFRMFPFIEQIDNGRLDVVLKLRADFPASIHGSNIVVRLAVPKSTSSCSFELSSSLGQTTELKTSQKCILWHIKKIQGGTEQFLRIKISLPNASSLIIRKEIGPATLDFEVPMFVCSGIHVSFLRVVERSRTFSPLRWIRYIAHSDSYIIRM